MIACQSSACDLGHDIQLPRLGPGQVVKLPPLAASAAASPTSAFQLAGAPLPRGAMWRWVNSLRQSTISPVGGTMYQITDGQFQLVYNVLSGIHDGHNAVLVAQGVLRQATYANARHRQRLVTFIAAFRYFRIFN